MLFLISIFSLIYTDYAYAYLDPASGSAILYIFIGVVTSVIFYARSIIIMGYSKILGIFNKSGVNKLKNDIVIYSEGKQYYSTFKPLVEEFLKRKVSITFLTSSKDDPILSIKDENLSVKYIGNQVLACSYLNYLKTKILVTTTPQLDVFSLKKTPTVGHYSHVVHAPTDIHTYRKYAFDFYDSILCSGPHQIKSIRALEKARKTPSKLLFETGLLHYDNVKESESDKDLSEITTILVAPTWKEYSLLNQVGSVLLEKLLNSGKYKVILRPHPQSFVSFKALTLEIINKFTNHPNFILDTESSGESSMMKSDILISDLSGIVWDYIFTQKKPVLLYQTPNDLLGFEDTEIPHDSWEKMLINNHLSTFDNASLPSIEFQVEELIQNFDTKEIINQRSKSVYNFKNAAPVACDQLLELLAKVK